MLYQLLRPSGFDGIYGNNSTVKSLQHYCKVGSEKQNHALLFHGPSGCGKTTLARIVAKEVGADDMSIIEYNAANTNGVDTIRDIAAKSFQKPLSGKAKVYLLDESHQLTRAAQEALLKVLEDYPMHVYYFLCTTAPDNIIPTVRNRCQDYQVQPLSGRDMDQLIHDVSEIVECKFSDEIIEAIRHLSNGSARAAVVSIEKIMGMDDDMEMLELLIEGSSEHPEIPDLVQLLVMPLAARQKRWKEAVELADKLTTTIEPESVRRGILGLLSWKLKTSTDKNAAEDYAALIMHFSKSTFYSGSSMLIAMVLQACNL